MPLLHRKLVVSCIGLQAGFATGFHASWTPRTSRAFSASRVCCALDSEESKALYTLGNNIGRQLGDLKVFSESELESVFLGIKDNVLGKSPQVCGCRLP